MVLTLLLAAAPGFAMPRFEVKPVEVPAALLAKTSPPEFSGLAFSAALGRYLVVSDDTGLAAAGTNHLPVTLAWSPETGLDAEPVPIDGLAKLNDAESICPGPDGTFFLLTSHSPNHDGKLKAARRALLHLGLESRRLKVLGQADLLELEGGTLVDRVGLRGAAVDLEAVAFTGDALLVGFKAPLTERGEAVIARIERPVAQLAAGRIAASTVSRWRAERLCVRPGLCEGVSDLVVTPNGALVVANAPKGAPADQGGALWWLETGRPAALLVKFDHLKPEGLALEPGRALIVFDRDRQAPEWTRLELPEAIAGAPR